MLLVYILFLLLAVYAILLFYYWQSWRAIPVYKPMQQGDITISVIIPARNEEENIGKLLQALQEQSYPAHLVEIIVIDDHSTDGTVEVVRKFENIKLLRLVEEDINSYKKKAIETGIAAASREMIVTTDADCIPPKSWLQTLAAFKKEKDAVFIAAPVALNPCPSPLWGEGNFVLFKFQAMDFMMLQGITGASVFKKLHSMCNGANLAYEKKVFYEVGGFSGIDHIASGDDMLLMHKIYKKYPEKLFYLKSKEAIVTTGPMQSWREFFNQRIRWASKAAGYDDKSIFLVLLLVWLLNVSLLLLFVCGFIYPSLFLYFLLFLFLKTIAELPFFISVSKFFDQQYLTRWFLFFQPLHIIYTVAAGFFGQLGKYEWKGRKVK